MYYAAKRSSIGFRKHVRAAVRKQRLALASSRGLVQAPSSKQERIAAARVAKRQVYDNPMPTVRACGPRIDHRWGRLGIDRVSEAAASAMMEDDARLTAS